MRRGWRAVISSVVLFCAGLFALLAPPPSPAADTAASLSLSKIILYSSGIGYFQHDGTVTDRTQLDLRLQTNQINDLLKSLVVQVERKPDPGPDPDTGARRTGRGDGTQFPAWHYPGCGKENGIAE